MNHGKETQVVMLPTGKEGYGVKNISGIVLFDKELYKLKIENTPFINGQNQYLYLLNDVRIEYKDWFMIPNGTLLQCGSGKADYLGYDSIIACNEEGNKKVIATTNSELNLPRPSDAFIAKYVEEYNKGNVLDKVLVEYESYSEIVQVSDEHDWQNVETVTLKVAPDNTITIKKIEETWNDIFDAWLISAEYKMNQAFNIWLKQNYSPPTKIK